MSAFDLQDFIARSRALVDSTPPTTVRETRAWLVDPFLETLGWDVHDESCLTDTTVDDTPLEYVCSVDGVPALFVAVEPFETTLEKSRAVELLETMAWTGVDRAIYTNGREFLFLAGTTDVERLGCQLQSLTEYTSAIGHYTRDTVGRRLERHSREFIARQLAIDRTSLVDAIVTQLTRATTDGDTYTAEFESAADRFVERLVASFAAERTRGAADIESNTESGVLLEFSEPTAAEPGHADDRRPAANGSRSDGAPAAESGRSSPPPSEPNAEQGPDRDSDGESDHDAPSGPESTVDPGSPSATDEDAAQPDDEPTERERSDTEFVVRFFNDRGSIGAIGHSSPDQALVGTAEYLFDRGLSGISVPWSPDEAADGWALLNDTPTHPDGTPMTDPQQLSNGLYLETAGETDEQAARVEALVARAGLRAMLSGDWENVA